MTQLKEWMHPYIHLWMLLNKVENQVSSLITSEIIEKYGTLETMNQYST
jgi:hypothetical protein